MKTFLTVLIGSMVVCSPAYAFFDDNSTNNNPSSTASPTVTANPKVKTKSELTQGDTVLEVLNPRPHREAPGIAVSTAPGQSGMGVSFPGGSVGSVKTDTADRALKALEVCNAMPDALSCTREELIQIRKAAVDDTRPCHVLGPVGKILTWPAPNWLNLRNTQGILGAGCF